MNNQDCRPNSVKNAPNEQIKNKILHAHPSRLNSKQSSTNSKLEGQVFAIDPKSTNAVIDKKDRIIYKQMIHIQEITKIINKIRLCNEAFNQEEQLKSQSGSDDGNARNNSINPPFNSKTDSNENQMKNDESGTTQKMKISLRRKLEPVFKNYFWSDGAASNES